MKTGTSIYFYIKIYKFKKSIFTDKFVFFFFLPSIRILISKIFLQVKSLLNGFGTLIAFSVYGLSVLNI